MSLDPPLIAGIVVVVVAFNLIIAVSWCIVRDRRKLKKLHRRRISAPVDCEKYEHSVAFAVSTGAAVPLKAKAKEHANRTVRLIGLDLEAKGEFSVLTHAQYRLPGIQAPTADTTSSLSSRTLSLLLGWQRAPLSLGRRLFWTP